VDVKGRGAIEKLASVTCYNCAEWGHFCTDCKEPKMCFVCQTSNHVGRECPEWMKPVESAQYLGSAAQGLGFFHIEVVEEKSRSGYLKFLDNCAVLSVEEGFIEVEEIVENLQKMFDPNWHWQLKEVGDHKYLVRFPPHRVVSATLISDATYFKMKKDSVLVSLRAWLGNVEAYDELEEVWVQVRGSLLNGAAGGPSVKLHLPWGKW
jgi:hypothetical protein